MRQCGSALWLVLLAMPALAGDKPAPQVSITSPADGHCTSQPSASTEVRSDILNAMGNSENPVFLGFVTDLAAKAEDASVKARAQRVRELLVMAENRRKVGRQP